jgi:hypothetical protein
MKILYLTAGFVFGTVLSASATLPAPGTDGPSQRAYQVAVMCRIVDPVLLAGSEGRLTPGNIPRPSDGSSPLQALGRTVAGIAPWLELGPGEDAEGRLRAHYIALTLASLRHAVDPASPGYLSSLAYFQEHGFYRQGQVLVDAAYLAYGLLRAPEQLWGGLDSKARAQVIEALKTTRTIKAQENNWLLFSAMVEAMLLEFTGECDMAPIEKAVNKHWEWYVGDGTYGDGPHFRWDYYNSYVIQPMLVDVLRILAEKKLPLGRYYPEALKRFQRYAQVQEMMISPEGTYPVIGRSSTYRFSAFQVLSLAALRHELPAGLAPGGVRSALNAVIHRIIEAPGTFDAQGWLTIGTVGHQPAKGEKYVKTGSLYMLTMGLLHLGLPADDPFWTEPTQPWTQQKIWSGENVPGDKHIGHWQ